MNRSIKVIAFALLCVTTGGLCGQTSSGRLPGEFYQQDWPAVSMAYTRVTLSSKLDENIRNVLVEEGQSVKKDDTLVEFESRLMEARIAVAEAEADLEARIEQARVDYEYLAKEFERSADLDEYVSESDLDKARRERDIARLRVEDLKRDQRLAEARLEFSRTQAKDYVIRSPIDGAVAHVWVEAGEMASTGEKLVEVIDPDVVEVRIHIPERYAGVACGQQALVRFTPFEDREFEGQVTCVSPYVESSSGTFMVKVLVERGTDDIKPGMGCRVRFVPRQEE